MSHPPFTKGLVKLLLEVDQLGIGMGEGRRQGRATAAVAIPQIIVSIEARPIDTSKSQDRSGPAGWLGARGKG